MQGDIKITVIATGFDSKPLPSAVPSLHATTIKGTREPLPNRQFQSDDLDIPAFLRRREPSPRRTSSDSRKRLSASQPHASVHP